MKRIKRPLMVSVCAVLIIASVISLGGIGYIAFFSRKNIKSDYDEMLFDMAKVGSYTEYYVDEGDNAADLSEYQPRSLCNIALGDTRKRWIGLGDVNEKIISGFVAVEDRKFYTHSGVDVKRTLYALLNSMFHFRETFGASTITQQVVKNISGDSEITLKRKLSEIIRAYNIEKNHSKDEIMELYLNIVPMGENIIGVNMAAEVYFGKEPKELSTEECATLIGITNAPTRYNPHIHPNECLKKRNDVLYAMHDFGILSKEEYEQAISQKLDVIPRSEVNEEPLSWFIETVNSDVISALCQKYNMSFAGAEALLFNGGLKIYTTENVSVQNTLEEYFSDKSNFPNEINRGLDYSMVVVDSKNGNLLGIVGSVGKKQGNKLLNLALVPRTPGSSLKPIALYAPLIDSGKINYATVFDDVPLDFKKSGTDYIEYPQNYPKRYDGLTTVKDALRLSKNTVAVKLYNMLGAEEIYRNLKSGFGFSSLVRHTEEADGKILTDLAPSPLALGQLSYGVSVRELTSAYTVFPSDGVLHSARSYIAVYDSNGNIILDNAPTEKRIFSIGTARIMNQLLMQVTKNGTASAITLKRTVDTAGKTGTSGDDKDRLFVGYTPYLTAGIWCGYRDSTASVGRAAPSHIEIWDNVMKSIHSKMLSEYDDGEIESFSTGGLIRREFCRDSGRLYSDNCLHDPRGSRLDWGYFLPSSQPTGLCDRHILCKYDIFAEGVACDGCPDEFVLDVSLLRIDRTFPKEIYITDAEYVWRSTDGTKPPPNDFDVPFFYPYIPEGDYVGRGRNKKQYNSFCFIHNG